MNQDQHFKLIDMIALLDDNKVDTSKVYDSHGGTIVLPRKKSSRFS